MTTLRIDPNEHPLTLDRLREILRQSQAEGARPIRRVIITPRQAYEMRVDFGAEQLGRVYMVTPPQLTLGRAEPEMRVYGVDIIVEDRPAADPLAGGWRAAFGARVLEDAYYYGADFADRGYRWGTGGNHDPLMARTPQRPAPTVEDPLGLRPRPRTTHTDW